MTWCSFGVRGVIGEVDEAGLLECDGGKGDCGEKGDLCCIGRGLGVLGGIAYGSGPWIRLGSIVGGLTRDTCTMECCCDGGLVNCGRGLDVCGEIIG